MPRALRILVLGAFVCGLLTFPFAAGAGHTTDPAVNLAPLGHSVQEPARPRRLRRRQPGHQHRHHVLGQVRLPGLTGTASPVATSGTRTTRDDHGRAPSATGTRATSSSGRTCSCIPGTRLRARRPVRRGLTCDGRMVPAGFGRGLHVFRHQQPWEARSSWPTIELSARPQRRLLGLRLARRPPVPDPGEQAAPCLQQLHHRAPRGLDRRHLGAFGQPGRRLVPAT